MHDLRHPPQLFPHPVFALVAAVVGRVQPRVRKARKQNLPFAQQELDPVSVHDPHAVTLFILILRTRRCVVVRRCSLSPSLLATLVTVLFVAAPIVFY